MTVVRGASIIVIASYISQRELLHYVLHDRVTVFKHAIIAFVSLTEQFSELTAYSGLSVLLLWLLSSWTILFALLIFNRN